MLHQALEASFYRSSLIASQHAMFICQGGVSQSPYTGLNLSYGVGDGPATVSQNRELVKQQLDVQYFASAVQIHSNCVAVVEGLGEDYEYKNVDALITQQSGVGLLILQADCHNAEEKRGKRTKQEE